MATEIFHDEDDDASIAQRLVTKGFAVVRLFERERTEALYETFKRSLRELPEYKSSCGGWRYCKTGFGALGVASSFHNHFVREMRLKAHARVAPIMAEVDKMDLMRAHVKDIPHARFKRRFKGYRRKLDIEGPRKLHQLLDRMLVRTENQTPTPESWHQDTASLIPETQHLHTPAAGFAKISDDVLRKIAPRVEAVEIPRGCLLIMNQSVVHEVVAKKSVSDPMCRLFTGWRLTYDDRTLLEIDWDAFFPAYTEFEREILTPHDPLEICPNALAITADRLKRKRECWENADETDGA
eukprot:gene1200-1773_t